MKSSLLLLLALAFPLTSVACKDKQTSEAKPDGQKSYSTAGTIKSFGDNKSYANITHDDIPGYMKSMTMSFEPRTPEQLKDLKEGDRVKFTFSEVDGKRMLDKIEK